MWFWSSKLFYMSMPYHLLAPIWFHYLLQMWFCFPKLFNKSTVSLGFQFDIIKFWGCDFHHQNPLMMHFGFVTTKFNVCDLEIQRQFWWIMIWKSRDYFNCLFMFKCESFVCVGSFFKEWQAFYKLMNSCHKFNNYSLLFCTNKNKPIERRCLDKLWCFYNLTH